MSGIGGGERTVGYFAWWKAPCVCPRILFVAFIEMVFSIELWTLSERRNQRVRWVSYETIAGEPVA